MPSSDYLRADGQRVNTHLERASEAAAVPVEVLIVRRSP